MPKITLTQLSTKIQSLIARGRRTEAKKLYSKYRNKGGKKTFTAFERKVKDPFKSSIKELDKRYKTTRKIYKATKSPFKVKLSDLYDSYKANIDFYKKTRNNIFKASAEKYYNMYKQGGGKRSRIKY